MVLTRSKLMDKEVIDDGFDCTNHKLQNAIKDTVKETETAELIEKAKKVAKYLHKSTVANRNLVEACRRTEKKH